MIFHKMFPSLSKEQCKTINTLAYRTRLINGSFNMVKMQGHAFLYAIEPALSNLYKDDPKELQEAFERHNQFFNCTPHVAGLIWSIVLAMEELRSKPGGKEEVSADAIQSMKVALCGPLSGIGDTLYQGIFRMLIAGVAISLGSTGNIMGPLFMLIGFGSIELFSRFYFTYLGYVSGSRAIQSLTSSGLLDTLKRSASVLGLTMIGSMSAAMVKIKLVWQIPVEEGALVIQDQLDAILPGLLSIVVIFSVFGLLRKKVAPIKIVFGMMLLCIILAFFGIL